MKKALTFILLAVLSCSLTFAGGNRSTTTLSGKVTDTQGNPLAGVKVELNNTQHTVFTNFDGEFTIENVPLKDQSIQLEYISFQKRELQLEAKALSSEVQIELKSK